METGCGVWKCWSLYIPFRRFWNLEYVFGSIVVLTLVAELRSVGCGVLN